jgi:hypothetical protein
VTGRTADINTHRYYIDPVYFHYRFTIKRDPPRSERLFCSVYI